MLLFLFRGLLLCPEPKFGTLDRRARLASPSCPIPILIIECLLQKLKNSDLVPTKRFFKRVGGFFLFVESDGLVLIRTSPFPRTRGAEEWVGELLFVAARSCGSL